MQDHMGKTHGWSASRQLYSEEKALDQSLSWGFYRKEKRGYGEQFRLASWNYFSGLWSVGGLWLPGTWPWGYEGRGTLPLGV